MNPKNQLISWTKIEELTGEPIPININEEKYLLGTILVNNNHIEYLDKLRPYHFFNEEHKIIYETMLLLITEKRAIDVLSVYQMCVKRNKHKIVTSHYLAQLSNYSIMDVMEIGNITHSIIELWIRRQMINFCLSGLKDSFDVTNDIYNITETYINKVRNVQNVFEIKDSTNINDIIIKRIKTISDLQQKKLSGETVNIGIPFPFERMNHKIGNMQPGDLIILAARPSMGKTALAEIIAEFVATQLGLPVDFYSKEMSKEQLADRSISRNSEIESKVLRSLEITIDNWKSINSKSIIQGSKLFIDDDNDDNDVSEIIKKARKRKREKGTQLIIIDYLQLLKDNEVKANRDEEVSSISRKLKKLARELEVPIIALCQLNRKVEERPNKEPKLSDLRESGSLEQDADLVMFLYRPAYYGITEDNGKNIEKIAQIIIAKHRNGSVGRVTLGFIEQFAKFTNLENVMNENNNQPF